MKTREKFLCLINYSIYSHLSDQNFHQMPVPGIWAAIDVGVLLSLWLLLLCSSFSFLFLPFILFLTFKSDVKRCFICCLCTPVKLFLMKLSTLLWNCLLLAFCESQVSVYTLDLPDICPTSYICFSDIFFYITC